VPSGTPRVVFVDAYPHQYGGAQRMTLLLAEQLARRGWHTEFWPTAEGTVAAVARERGITVRALDLPPALRHYGGSTFTTGALAKAVAAAPAVMRTLARDLRAAADVVHLNDHRAVVIAGPSARWARRPVIWHVHSVHRSRALNVACSRIARRIVVPSSAVIAQMPGLGAGRPVTVIPNALVPRAVVPSAADTGGPRLVTVGRLHPDKGLDILLRSVARVKRTHPRVVVDIVGGRQLGVERYADELLALRDELDLADNVVLHGDLADPLPLVAAADLYVQPSRQKTEVQPIAVLEAMDLARPIVATRSGGLPELIVDRSTGILVDPEDEAALATAIVALLDAPDRAADLGSAAQAFVREHFDAQRFVDRVEDVLRAALR
jgi:glycosyltransferase involved in cell wall biosynthesis